MSDITIVGMCSLYREGRLARLAVKSLVEAELDAVIVFEGIAGKEHAEGPATDVGEYRRRVSWCEGVWATDAEKLTTMLNYAKQNYKTPLWGVWLAGDEVLVNGEHLRDMLQRVEWDNDVEGRSILNPENFPTVGVPLRTVEHDGSVGLVRARCVRLDLIRRYVVSSHVLELVGGQVVQQGTQPDSASQWLEPRVAAYVDSGRDQNFLLPPLPGEPFTIHRSYYRHPDRQRLRMHVQERAELLAAGLPVD